MRRTTPPLWLHALWLLLLLAGVWLWLGDPGDEGMRNAFTFVLLVLAASAGWLWFVLASAHPGRRRLLVALGVPLVLVVLGLLVEVRGFSGAMVPNLGWRLAGDAPVPVAAAEAAPRAIDLATTGPRDFPGFLGAERDAEVRGVELATDWDARPPQVLWRRPVGEGWSGFAVVNGFAVTLEQRGDQEVCAAYELATGEPVWTWSSSGRFENFLGGPGPRSTPTIANGRVVGLGALGLLFCLDGATGELVWKRDLLADHGVTPAMETANVLYGRSSSPLVFDDVVVVPAGGDASTRMAGLVACDAATGAVRWESPPRQISFASPALVELAGRRQILCVNEDTVTGHDPADGAILWEHAWPGRTSGNASVSQARVVGERRVFVSKGYGVGAALLELTHRDDGTFDVAPVWRDRRALRTKLTNVAIREGHVYGLSDGRLECVALATGERVWKDGNYGHGQLLLVGDVLLITSEEGELVLVAATPERENEVLARMPVLDGQTWNNPALYGDVLLMRNASEMAALRLPLSGEG